MCASLCKVDRWPDSGQSEEAPKGRRRVNSKTILSCIIALSNQWFSVWLSGCDLVFHLLFVSSMVQLCLRLRAESHKTPSIVKALRSVNMDAQLERGFLSSRIYQEVNDPDALCMEQEWSSAAALESHFRSSCFTKVLQIMETAPNAPVLEVHAISAVQGLEYVDKVRFGER